MTHFIVLTSLFVSVSASAKIERSEPLRLTARTSTNERTPASAGAKPNAIAAPPTTSGRMNAQGIPFKQKSLGPKGYLTNTEIGGCCILMGTRVRVETLDGKAVQEGPIQTIETFTLSGLKPDTLYNLFFTHSRFPNGIRLDKVKAGNWINFSVP